MKGIVLRSTFLTVGVLSLILALPYREVLASPVPRIDCKTSLKDSPDSEINIRSDVASRVLRQDLSLSEIRELEKEKESLSYQSVLGFTTWETKTGYSISVEYAQRSGRSGVCVRLKSIDLDFKVTKLQVLMPSEYKAGSCEYQEVHAHEDEHVRILKDTHEEYLGVLNKALSKGGLLSQLSKAAYYENVESGKDDINEALDQLVLPIIDEYANTLTQRESEIDSTEHYQEVTGRCSEWEKTSQMPHS